MALSMRKQVIFAALESAEGSDAISAMTVADTIICSAPQLSPLEGSSISRDLIRPYYGNAGEIRVENFVKMDFETELSGATVAGNQPVFASLLKACNFKTSGTQFSGMVATDVGNSVTSFKLSAGASGAIGAYIGQYLLVDGVARKISVYNTATKIVTLDTALNAIPADDTPVSIGLTYTPVSSIEWGNSSANKSCTATMLFEIDGIRHAMKGARGTFSIDMSAKKIPKIKWSFTGLLIPPTDATTFSGSVLTGKTPAPTGTTHTKNISLFGSAVTAIETMTFDIANDVKYRQLIGTENVYIIDRKPKGSISFEVPNKEAITTAGTGWFDRVKNNDSGAFTFTHGTAVDNTFLFEMPNVQLSNPKYSDSDGIAMISMDLMVLPLSSTGNDEFALTIF